MSSDANLAILPSELLSGFSFVLYPTLQRQSLTPTTHKPVNPKELEQKGVTIAQLVGGEALACIQLMVFAEFVLITLR